MKYGEIKWKVEKIVFKIDGGIIKRTCEIDEGRAPVRKIQENVAHNETMVVHQG